LADRRRRISVRDEADVGGGRQTTGGSGLTRFIKRLSHGDRKPPAAVLPAAPPQRRNDAARRSAEPLTPSGVRLPPPPPPSLTGTKRHRVEFGRALSSRRSTSVLGLNSVGTASQKTTRTVVRPAAQRAIRYR